MQRSQSPHAQGRSRNTHVPAAPHHLGARGRRRGPRDRKGNGPCCGPCHDCTPPVSTVAQSGSQRVSGSRRHLRNAPRLPGAVSTLPHRDRMFADLSALHVQQPQQQLWHSAAAQQQLWHSVWPGAIITDSARTRGTPERRGLGALERRGVSCTAPITSDSSDSSAPALAALALGLCFFP